MSQLLSSPLTAVIEEDEEEEDEPHTKKHIQLDSLTVKNEEEAEPPSATTPIVTATTTKKSKSKKKNNNVWVTKSTRKGKQKSKSVTTPSSTAVDDKVLITPFLRFPDKGDDTPDSIIRLSRVYKAEKVEVSEDRLTAGSRFIRPESSGYLDLYRSLRNGDCS